MGLNKKLVLSLCDKTGNMVRPWAEAGYPCKIIDITHPPGEISGPDGITRVGADIRRWLPPREDIEICFAFPPCTNLAVSGARWFKEKGLHGLAEGIELVERCAAICEWTEAPWMLENPVSTLSSYWREPDYRFDPYEFGGYLDPPGDAYSKKTCLWVGNGFRFPRPKAVEPAEGSKMWKMPDSKGRADRRSATPEGFAAAVFQVNSPHRGVIRAG